MLPRESPGHRPGRRRFLCAMLALVLLAGFEASPRPAVDLGPAALSPSPPAALAAPEAQGVAPDAIYRLVATWEDVPWQIQAGRFARAGDLTRLSDGRFALVDGRHNRIHLLGAEGRPLEFWDPHAGDPGAVARRVDAAADGGLWLLSWRAGALGQPSSQIDHLDARGQRIASWRDPRPLGDLAADVEGRLLVTVRTDQPRVLVLDGQGGELADFGREHLQHPLSLDVADDGRVYVVNRVLQPGPGAGATATPGPAPTREPSIAAAPGLGPALRPFRAPGQATAEPEAPVEGVLVFGPGDHALQRSVPIVAAADVAVGPAGAFVSRELEILPLDDPERPRYALPYPRLIDSRDDGPALHLEVPPRGLAASLWHCYFQGWLGFEDARSGSPRLSGGIDRPFLAGPAYPRRITADEGLFLLQGRFASLPDGQGGWSHHPAEIALESEPQSIQRWTSEGRLDDQLGVCAGHPNAPAARWARDVATAGGAVYSLDPDFVRKREGADFPAWSHWAGEQPAAGAPQLTALAAAGERIEYLDAGGRRLVALSSEGQVLEQLALDRLAGGAGGGSLPADLALDEAGRRYLADAGGRRLLIDAADRPAQLDLHDLPERVAVGPAGRVFVLGRSGMALRYDPGPGGLELGAAWSMPEAGAEALDIAVDAGGRVYVSFAERGTTRLPSGGFAETFLRAGTWVFEPAPAPARRATEPGACILSPDKRAAPERLRLGETVDVELVLDGRCPGQRQPITLALVVDHSRSMAWDGALERLREAGIDLLSELDPSRDRLHLFGFADDASLPPVAPDDPAGAATWLAGLRAGGDTRLTEALERAVEALAGASGRKVVLILTDGGLRDDPGPAAERALSEGIELGAWVFRTDDFPGLSLAARMVGGARDAILLDPDEAQRRAWFEAATDWQRPEQLLEVVTVVDRIPDNMRYLAGSAEPAASYDAAAHSLHWDLGPLAAEARLRLRYRLEPLEPGDWPTNIEALADYRDGLGRSGQLRFPLPRVEVIAPEPPSGRIYLPLLAREACLLQSLPLDLILALDTSQSMAAPAEAGGSKLDAARLAARGLLDRLDLGRDRVAVLGFDAQARAALGLSDDRERIESALAGLVTASGTRLDLGLRAARGLLRGEARPGARPVVILLTDGLHGGSAIEPRLEADLLAGAGSLIYTIGLGEQIDRQLLESIANPPGSFYASPGTAELAEIYRAILIRVACDAQPRPDRASPTEPAPR